MVCRGQICSQKDDILRQDTARARGEARGAHAACGIDALPELGGQRTPARACSCATEHHVTRRTPSCETAGAAHSTAPACKETSEQRSTCRQCDFCAVAAFFQDWKRRGTTRLPKAARSDARATNGDWRPGAPELPQDVAWAVSWREVRGAGWPQAAGACKHEAAPHTAHSASRREVVGGCAHGRPRPVRLRGAAPDGPPLLRAANVQRSRPPAAARRRLGAGRRAGGRLRGQAVGRGGGARQRPRHEQDRPEEALCAVSRLPTTAPPPRPSARRPPPTLAAPRRSPADDELRKLGKEIVRLAPRSVQRLSLSPELMEVFEEWNRVGGKRGSGSAKKGKARLEGLLAQCAGPGAGRGSPACMFSVLRVGDAREAEPPH